MKTPWRKGVVVEWHSFQLDPNLESRPDLKNLEYFTKVKQVTEEEALEMIRGTQKMASEVGLNMELENSVVANSFRAHLIIQLAKKKHLANELEEALFGAHFSLGKNIDDTETLLNIATQAGLTKEEASMALSSEEFAYAVKQDEMHAQQIGVRGVPFFVFAEKYAVSGAQSTETFLEVLEKVHLELT